MTPERLMEVRMIVNAARRRYPARFVEVIRAAGVSDREFMIDRGLDLLAWIVLLAAVAWGFKLLCDWVVG